MKSGFRSKERSIVAAQGTRRRSIRGFVGMSGRDRISLDNWREKEVEKREYKKREGGLGERETGGNEG